MKTINLKTILLLFLLCSLPSFAESQKEGKEKQHPIERLDTDGDQLLSLAEFSQSKKLTNLQTEQINTLFSRLDKNADGSLSIQELPHHHRKGKPWRHMAMEELDADLDGKISLEEFLAKPSRDEHDTAKRREKLFTMLDRNQDGFLSKSDRPKRGEKPFHRRPHGSEIDGEHRPPHPPHEMMRNRMQRLDTDQDDSISLDEFLAGERIQKMDGEAAKSLFNHMDRNGDGVINREDEKKPKLPKPE